MFSSKAEKPAAKTGAKRAAVPSIISTDLHIAGNLETSGQMQIDGSVEGDVTCGALTIGEGATVAGEVTAETVIVHGRIEGRIRAKKVELSRTARITGDIWHDSLSIEAGAYLDGHCRRNETEPARSLKVMPGGDAAKPAAEAPRQPAVAQGQASTA